MALSVFDDKTRPPNDDELATVLGKVFPTWQRLADQIFAAFPGAFAEWGFTSKSTGWGLRLKTDKRTILYMTPRERSFLVSFALGEKAARAAQDAGLPASVLKTIDNAPKYAEGRGVRFEITTASQIRSIAKLAQIKMEY